MTALAVTASAAVGLVLVPLLCVYGLHCLGAADRSPSLRAVAPVIGAAAGIAAAALAAKTGEAAAWPGLMAWAATLTAAAACDALTRRVPTPLVRQAAVATALLLLLAAGLTGTWTRLGWAFLGSVVSGLLLALGERYAGVGRGDVRLAVLGGLGLGWVGLGGAWIGLAVLCAVSLVQVLVAFARGGDRRTHIPYGPALVAGFLAAALAA